MTHPIAQANFYRINFSPIGKTVGILGGGQLGLMLAQSVLPLGIRCVFLEDAPNCPARLLGKVYSSEQWDDFAQSADTFTLEFENTPLTQAQQLTTNHTLFPTPVALGIAQDRLQEKRLFNSLGIKTVDFCEVLSYDGLQTAVATLGLPLVLKTSRGGYDGKGQFVINTPDDVANAWQKLGGSVEYAPLIAEGFVDFDYEVSIIAVRSQAIQGTNDVRFYPLNHNVHHQGISAKTTPLDDTTLNTKAQAIITKILNHLDYVGVLTLELFVQKEELIANEIAPRVHNSGHWSIEGAATSQFANHMRAVAGLPLGATDLIKPCAMLNIIGDYPDVSALLALPDVYVHLYDKQARVGRKLGHITLLADNHDTLQQRMAEVVALLPNKMNLQS